MLLQLGNEVSSHLRWKSPSKFFPQVVVNHCAAAINATENIALSSPNLKAFVHMEYKAEKNLCKCLYVYVNYVCVSICVFLEKATTCICLFAGTVYRCGTSLIYLHTYIYIFVNCSVCYANFLLCL